MKLNAYCMDWHLSRSGAFHDLVVDSLKQKLEVELVDIKKWQPDPGTPQLFCQVAPPDVLLSDPTSKVVWIPMWDNVHGNSQAWWQALPKHLRVVCFSTALYKQVRQAGLPSIHLTYFKDSERFKPATWDKRVIYYWNRTGLIGPDFLRKLCIATGADKLIFRSDLDPGVPQKMYYELGNKLGPSMVETVHEMDQQKYLEVVQESNIYFAPRSVEGVGMTFIEAMARGAAVIAYNAPTMNEYIKHNRTGYLCDNVYSRRLASRARNRTRKIFFGQSHAHLLSDLQPWADIAKLDWHKLGRQAHDESKAGYQRWLKDTDSYYQFLTRW